MMRFANSSGSLMKSMRMGSRSRGAVAEFARSVPTMDFPSVFFLRFGLCFGVLVDTGAWKENGLHKLLT